jgi:prepilin-type processing-associated H-X9-DG protein
MPRGWHWRSVYHPNPDSIRNPNGMCFIGDTNNVVHITPNHTSVPGEWWMAPGYGNVTELMGFERHGDKIEIGYVDGHARSLPKAEAVNHNPNWGHYWPDAVKGTNTGDPWMFKYVGEDSCKIGTHYSMHNLAPLVTE